MININLLVEGTKFAVNAPYFWGSMGFTAAIAMYVGAALYDGQLDQVKKGLLSVLSYASMIMWVTFSRVSAVIFSGYAEEIHPERPVANLVATLFVTISWVVGVVLGVLVFSYKYKGKHHV